VQRRGADFAVALCFLMMPGHESPTETYPALAEFKISRVLSLSKDKLSRVLSLPKDRLPRVLNSSKDKFSRVLSLPKDKPLLIDNPLSEIHTFWQTA
jgi:hypothetical protein